MQTTHEGVYPGTSAIYFMPMIDGNPAKKYGMTPVETFDQTLYWKPQTIVKSERADSDSLFVG